MILMTAISRNRPFDIFFKKIYCNKCNTDLMAVMNNLMKKISSNDAIDETWHGSWKPFDREMVEISSVFTAADMQKSGIDHRRSVHFLCGGARALPPNGYRPHIVSNITGKC